MAGRPMQAARCPTDELSLTNCAVVNEKDFQSGQHVMVKTSPNHKYIFTLRTHPSVVPGSIAFSLPQVWDGWTSLLCYRISKISFGIRI
uniref:Vesicle-fusing ATPase n=1 Tax=Cyanistes caeruleus TaxID=156563 RepID=A0A8C0ZJA9_CYACU